MRPHRLFLFSLCLATSLNPLNSSMITVSLVAFREDFGLSVADVTWVVTAFYITSATMQPLLGQVADTHGPRRMLLASMAVIVVGSVLAASATSWLVLCAARVAIACGTSAAFPAAIALIDRDAPPVLHVKMLARIQLSANVGVATGPVVGGILLSTWGWRALFVVSIPLAAIASVGVLRSIRRDATRLRRSHLADLRALDLPGVLILSVALTASVLTIQSNGSLTRAAFATAAIGAAAMFVRTELRHPRPAVDLRVLRTNRGLARMYPAWLLLCLFYYSVLYGLPQVLEDVGGLSHAAVGTALTPLAITSAVITPAVVWALQRIATRKVVVAGAGLSVLACGISIIAAASANVWVGALISCALGLSNGVVTIATSQRIFDSAARGQIGTSAGMFQSLRYTGAIGSTCILSVVFDERATSTGWAVTVAIASVACVLALGLVVRGNRTAES